MRRIAAWLGACLAFLIVGVPLLLLLFANIGPGRAAIETLTGSLTGGMVRLEGLHGRFPDALRLDRLSITDEQGAWLVAEGVALDWSPLALLGGTAHVERLAASTLSVTRLPASSGSATPAPATPGAPWYDYRLPVHVVLDALDLPHAQIGAPVAGAAATLAAHGHADATALQDATLSLAIDRLDAPGHYQIDGQIDAARIEATIAAHEPARGFAATAGGLPDLGALSLDASIKGPRDAEALALRLAAGPLSASADGTVDLSGQTATVAVSAHAPAMIPAPGISWQSVSLDAHVQGAFNRPDADGTLAVERLVAGGATIGAITAKLAGNQGAVTLHGALAELRIPGPAPDLFAATPVSIDADARLDDASRPVRFHVSHKLLDLKGEAKTAGPLAATAHLDLPSLAPFAGIGGVAATGHASFDIAASQQGSATHATVDGTLGLMEGPAPAPALLGNDAHVAVAATMDGQMITLDHLKVDGAEVSLGASGTDKAGILALDWQLGLPSLKTIAPTLTGAVKASGHLSGPTDDLAADATINGTLGAPGVPAGPIEITAQASGLPGKPTGTITARGTLDGAPLTMDARAERKPDGTMAATLAALAWKSAKASGDALIVPGQALPRLSLDATIGRLADLSPFVGQALRGSVTARIETAKQADRATVDLRADGIGAPGGSAARVTLAGTIDTPTTAPRLDLRLDAQGIEAGAISGSATLAATGPESALGLRLSANLHGVAGGDATAQTTATLDLPAKTITLASLEATVKGETARLLAPAKVSFGNGLAVDRVRLGVQQAVLDIAGKLSPRLDLTASLRDVTPALAKPFAPTPDAAMLDGEGRLSADARLTGDPASPDGTIRLAASGLRMHNGPAASLPPASIDAQASLAGGNARLTARIGAGPRLALALDGTAPLSAKGALDLHARGNLDLALVDPITEASGRRVSGEVSLDLAATGPVSAPRLAGTVDLARGEVQDFAQGARLSNISARLHGDGQSLTIDQLVAHAGEGTIGASGRIGLAETGLPVDLTITARHARPLSSDRLTAVLDADLTLRGQAASRLDAAGTIHVDRADIAVPDSFPPSVAVLDVRRRGQKPPPPSGPGLLIGLGITVDAPEQIFVRGHGLDAEMGGRLTVGGTSAAPQIAGGFDLRRGTFSLAGANLTFVRGRVAFDGAGLSSRIDPTLDFEADTYSGSVTAKLLIGGYASKPKITLASDPSLPQDEIIAHLLFGVSVKQLSAFQLAQIGAALASLTGVTSSDPLGNLQKRLGLDRLSVGGGSGASNTGATIEAGRYVAKGVYVGAKQGTDGGTQAQVQVDLTRHLKLQSTLGTGGGSAQGATPENDPGSSVGLSYQFEY